MMGFLYICLFSVLLLSMFVWLLLTLVWVLSTVLPVPDMVVMGRLQALMSQCSYLRLFIASRRFWATLKTSLSLVAEELSSCSITPAR